MMKLPFVLLFCLLAGCVGTKPATLSDTEYTNPDHEYRIKIFENWEATTETDDKLEACCGGGFKLLMLNKYTDGIIVVNSHKMSPWIDTFRYSKDFKKDMEASLKKGAGKKEVEDYKCIAINPHPPFPALASIEEGVIKFGDIRRQFISKIFFHPCHKNDTCSVTISLISNPNTFSENERTFDKIIEEFEYDGWIIEVVK